MLYGIVIFMTIAICEGASVGVYYLDKAVSLAYAICAPLFLVVFCGLLLGLLDILVRLMPQSLWRYDKKPFIVSKSEVKFYEKLGIKKWKDKAVPELGVSAGFSKKYLKGTALEYLERFLIETCQGETLHASGAASAFLFLMIYPTRDWYFVLPILAVNFLINLLPCMIQRYNRYRLAAVYHFKERHATRDIEETEGEQGASADDAFIQEQQGYKREG